MGDLQNLELPQLFVFTWLLGTSSSPSNKISNLPFIQGFVSEPLGIWKPTGFKLTQKSSFLQVNIAVLCEAF